MTDALRPPEKWAHLRWHWLKNQFGNEMPAYWGMFGSEWTWLMWRFSDNLTPNDAVAEGYIYSRPCDPPATLDAALTTARAEIEQLKSDAQIMAHFILGHTPDRNTQTPREVAETEVIVEDVVKRALSAIVERKELG